MSLPINFSVIYEQNRKAMYRAAYAHLRSWGRESEVDDVVSDAITSILGKPPTEEVRNWEAFLVTAAIRKAQDLTKSARAQRTGTPYEPDRHDQATDDDIAADVAAAVDLQRDAEHVPELLDALTDRERHIVWQVKALGRSRQELADELDVDATRISQICTAALKKLRHELNRRKETP